VLGPELAGEPAPGLVFTGDERRPGELAGLVGAIASDRAEASGLDVVREFFTGGDGTVVGIRLVVRNRRAEPIRLRSLVPMAVDGPDGLRLTGADFADWRIVRMARHKNDIPGNFRPGERDADFRDALFESCDVVAGQGVAFETLQERDRAGRRVLAEPCMIFRDSRRPDGPAVFVGVLGQDEHLSQLALTVAEDGSSLEQFRVMAEMDDVQVDPGEPRATHWLLVAAPAGDRAALDSFAELVARLYRVPPPPPPPSIYCSWYFYGHEMTEQDLDENLAVLARRPIPFDVFLIDLCWIDTFGTWQANEAWPRGMADAARRIRAAGYRPGIWTCPFIVMADSPILKKYPDLVARDSQGRPCLFGFQGPTCYAVDLTADCVEEYFVELYGRLREWGYTFHKLDFLRAPVTAADVRFRNAKMTRAQAYRRGMALIRKAAGPDAYILACGGLYEGTVGLADCVRSGSDTIGDWVRAGYAPDRPATLMTIKQNVWRSYTNRFWHTDPDAAMLRLRSKPFHDNSWSERLSTGRFTEEEAFTVLVNQYLGGGVTCFSERLADLQDERRAMLRYVLPPFGPAALALDPEHPDCPTRYLSAIQPKCPSLCPWWTLAVANWSAEPVIRRIRLREIPFGRPADRLAVFEFRTQQFLGVMSNRDEIVLEVPVHGTRLLRLAPWSGDQPIILGTDLHLSGGGCELAEVAPSEEAIRGRVVTRWDLPVRVTGLFPTSRGPAVTSAVVAPGGGPFTLTAPVAVR